MRTLFVGIFAVFLAFSTPTYAAGQPALFQSEQEAQGHCPKDAVVWVNLPTGVYHFKGERWYGLTKQGAYVCQKEADQAGDRATRNGQ